MDSSTLATGGSNFRRATNATSTSTTTSTATSTIASTINTASINTANPPSYPCLRITLGSPPEYLSKVLRVVPEADVGQVGNKDEAITRTKTALQQLRGTWLGDSAEWKEFDSCLSLNGYPPDPSKQIKDMAVALDVLHIYFKSLAQQAVSSQENMDLLVASIMAVKAFTLANAHAGVQHLYQEEFQVLRRGITSSRSSISVALPPLSLRLHRAEGLPPHYCLLPHTRIVNPNTIITCTTPLHYETFN
ncbi:hypothetical protein BC829DRAFT_281190 [Chytridium lagenaria]|nr:hypothetical protein BC829DRAFT_281190 [Chytridium lagenaria]